MLACGLLLAPPSTIVVHAQAPVATIPSIPRLLPGDSCSKAIALMGKPQERNEFLMSWDLKGLSVSAGISVECVVRGVFFVVDDGALFRTRDGIVLGRDTVGAVERRLAKSGAAISTEAPEGNWVALITVPARVGFPHQTVYSSKWKFLELEKEPSLESLRREPVGIYELQ